MSIHTNRLKIRFHIDAIENDFAFICFTRKNKGNWNGAAQLDNLIGEDYKAHSVMFQYGQFAYAMFKKPVDVYGILSHIRGDEQFDGETAIEVPPRASRNDAKNSICEAWLAQILLNSLSSSRSRFSQYHYCNLTGGLLLVPDAGNRNYIDIAKIIISRDYLLQAKTVRYRKKIAVLSELKKTDNTYRRKTLKNALEGPNYIFNAATGSLRRILPRDGKIDPKLTYVRSGLAGKKATMPFLGFGSLKDFNSSRSGITYHVLQQIQKHLSKYMQIEFTPLNPEKTMELKTTILNNPKQLQPNIEGQHIKIVDKVVDEDSMELAVDLKALFNGYVTDKKLITIGKRDKKGALNFRIIHNAAYYEKNGTKDEYLPSTKEIQRQHLTIESMTTASTAIVKTLIKELLIKRDISNRAISLFDWGRLETSKKWTFATCDEKARKFVFMVIQPDGRFEFETIDGTALFGHQEYKKYVELISGHKKSEFRTGLIFEGLVVSAENDINLIFRSEEITLPDLSRIESILHAIEENLPNTMQSAEKLSEVINEFSRDQADMDAEKFKLFSEELSKLGKQIISKKDFKSLISQNLGGKRGDKPIGNTKEVKAVHKFLLDRYNIRLKFPQDNQSKNELFDASLNINYFDETDTQAFYYVGGQRDQVQFSFKDACHIRKIVAVKDSKLVFRQLLATMDVDFVRTGQSTVIPFPFKYIREYGKFNTQE